MELSSEEGEIPMPINSVFSRVVLHSHGYAHQGHMTTHQYQHDQEPPSSTTSHDHNNNNLNGSSIGALNLEDKQQEVPYNSSDKDCNNNNNPNLSSNARSYSTPKKMMVKFKECLKNHAASMGGTAIDGCGEFMPSGEEGTLEALTCSACNCHRNFHRKEIVGENKKHYAPHSPHFYLSTPHHQPHHILSTGGRKVILGSGGSPGGSGGGQGLIGYPKVAVGGAGTLVAVSRAMTISVPYQVSPNATPSDQSDDHDRGHDHQFGGAGGVMVRPSHNYQLVKKRFRTKFSQEQKEKMLEFAEKVGWKIQRQEDSVVQQFCQEIGVKRRVLKVWMHNNKLTLAKNNHPNTNHHEDNNNNNINSSLV